MVKFASEYKDFNLQDDIETNAIFTVLGIACQDTYSKTIHILNFAQKNTEKFKNIYDIFVKSPFDCSELDIIAQLLKKEL